MYHILHFIFFLISYHSKLQCNKIPKVTKKSTFDPLNECFLCMSLDKSPQDTFFVMLMCVKQFSLMTFEPLNHNTMYL